MYPITNAVMALFEAEQRKVLRITGTDKNGTSITITDDNVIADSFQIDRYSCNGEKLEVGTAIAAQLSFTLENGSGLYNSIVFEGAELFVEVGIADWTQSSPTVTYVPCGYFTPDDQPRRLSTISITALDRMTKFDIVVDGTNLTFPTTVAGLVGQACTQCGVTLAQSISGLVNAGVNVAEMPTAQGDITYRNLIQWCAGIMGTNAWFDWNGQLRFSWYENATGYVSTTDNRYNSDMYEDDLIVSGVEYTNDSGIVIVDGTDDYAIDLTGNAIAGPLVATVLPALNTALNGFTYRPFTAATVNAPYLWPMDVVTFTDRDGNNHTSVLTNVAFGLNGTTAMESKGMTYAINKLAQPKGFTREQAQLVSQAMEHVEKDIDDSLTQQEIFNRLTDNGAAQGLVLYNGQVYMNATYMRSGTIDGDYVNAKKFIVVDENNNVIASFDSKITLGKSTNTNVELDYNSFEIKGQSGNVFLKLGDARDEQGMATVQDTYVGDGNNTNFLLHVTPTTINSVKVDGVTVSNWSLSDNIVMMTTAPAKGAVVVITYVTEQPVYQYTLGMRDPNDGIGIWSVAEGYYVGASGFASHAEGRATNAPGYISHAEGYYSTADGYAAHAEGYDTNASGNGSHAEGWETEASGTNSHTEGNSTEASGECGHAEGGDTVASGDYSHAEGRGTIASATAQHVVGKYNVSDDLKLEIVGNGTNDNNRSNARTLDESGNEWIAGALNVGNPGQTRTNLGITPANIGAVNKSGDKMTGDLYINRAAASNESVRFGTTAGQSSDFISVNQNDWGIMYYILPVKKVSDGTLRSARFSFFEFSPNADGTRSANAEIYNLPNVDVGRTSSASYNILTSKNAVTIAQGGTGATTAADARRNLGAVNKAGDTMTGRLIVSMSGSDAMIYANNADTEVHLALDNASSGNHGLWSAGYYDGSAFVSSSKWLIYRNTSGNVIVNGIAENVSGVVSVPNGGTGGSTAYSGRRNLNASAGIRLIGSDDTVAKIRQKLETIGEGETATIYLSRVPLNLITGRTADQYYLSGTVNRVNADVFVFDLVDVVTTSFRWSFRATITSTSASCGTIYKYTGTALT